MAQHLSQVHWGTFPNVSTSGVRASVWDATGEQVLWGETVLGVQSQWLDGGFEHGSCEPQGTTSRCIVLSMVFTRSQNHHQPQLLVPHLVTLLPGCGGPWGRGELEVLR